MWSKLIPCIALCIPPLLTYAVKVRLSFGMDDRSLPAAGSFFFAQTCRDLRPGMCCQAWPRRDLARSWSSGELFRHHYPVAEWTGLESFDIAAVWQPRYGTETSESDRWGCGGIVAATKPGPGNWRYEVDFNIYENEKLSGASYFRVPQGQPKNKEAPWLEAQGILGLVTRGGEWLSARAGRGLVTQQVAAAYGGGSHRRRRRAIISEDEGILVAQAPRDSQMPDVIEINGIEYEAAHSGSPIYRNADGVMLNMTNDGQ